MQCSREVAKQLKLIKAGETLWAKGKWKWRNSKIAAHLNAVGMVPISYKGLRCEMDGHKVPHISFLDC